MSTRTTGQGMTREELLALPAAVPLDTASRALGVGRTKGQQLARAGEYPVRVLTIGNRRKVASADLLEHLGIRTTTHTALGA